MVVALWIFGMLKTGGSAVALVAAVSVTVEQGASRHIYTNTWLSSSNTGLLPWLAGDDADAAVRSGSRLKDSFERAVLASKLGFGAAIKHSLLSRFEGGTCMDWIQGSDNGRLALIHSSAPVDTVEPSMVAQVR